MLLVYLIFAQDLNHIIPYLHNHTHNRQPTKSGPQISLAAALLHTFSRCKI